MAEDEPSGLQYVVHSLSKEQLWAAMPVSGLRKEVSCTETALIRKAVMEDIQTQKAGDHLLAD